MTEESMEHVIARLAAVEETDFRVLAEPGEIETRRGLYVLVHPGDVVQARDDVGDGDEADAILEYSRRCQQILASEVEALVVDDDWDVVVLHRQSSDYAFTGDADYDYRELMPDPGDDATLLWGDDLPAAAAYLLATMRASERPLVVLGGAWSEARHGCVASIGEALELGGCATALSRGACISPDGSGVEWTPSGGKVDLEAMHLTVAGVAASP